MCEKWTFKLPWFFSTLMQIGNYCNNGRNRNINFDHFWSSGHFWTICGAAFTHRSRKKLYRFAPLGRKKESESFDSTVMFAWCAYAPFNSKSLEFDKKKQQQQPMSRDQKNAVADTYNQSIHIKNLNLKSHNIHVNCFRAQSHIK